MPRGGAPTRSKKNYKGQHRRFTSEDELKAQMEKERKEREWRAQHGQASDDSDEETGGESGAKAGPAKDESSEESTTDSEDGVEHKSKGIQHLIEIENPNRIAAKTKKVTALNVETPAELTRKEREDLEKQAAKAAYMKLHLAGKTEEAQHDMARLAIIKKQREEAALKRADEIKAKDDAKRLAEAKLLEKKQNAAKQ